MLATFNLQGYDPDIHPEAYQGGGGDLKGPADDRIFYFLASRRKMGMLVANQSPRHFQVLFKVNSLFVSETHPRRRSNSHSVTIGASPRVPDLRFPSLSLG
eukprot:1307343-Pyramimonas_sp.AAC.1